MEKLQLGTQDGTDLNVERLGELFPQVVTEVQGDDGKTRRAVDFDALRDLLGDVAEGQRERYQFTWPGKAEAKAEARRPIAKTMRPQKDKSVNWDTTQNLYIEGDNLDALKILKETYAGQVKLIYIDPPYNTGHDFVYDDDFAKTRGEYDATSGDYDEEGGRLVANTEGNGRFHSDWCSMMYPRLMLARDLLSADGAIFISIDDNECAQLKQICSEVFGNSNFEGHIHWRRRHTQPNDKTKMLGLVAEHMLVYAKDSKALKAAGVGKLDPTADFSNPDNDPLGPWASKPWKVGSDQSGSRYVITAPGGEMFDESWMGEEATYKRFLNEGRIYFPKDGHGLPRKKYYQFEREEEGQCATNWWTHELFGHNQAGNDCVTELFEGTKNVFSNPKPIELMQGVLKVGNVKDNDIVLDFFSGSASMAHAVMALNSQDGANRHFIMVQIPQTLEENDPGYALGFRVLTEIGEERIRRAGAKIASEVEEANRQLKMGEAPKSVPDIGFRVLSIDSSNMCDTLATPEETTQESLFGLADNVKDGRSDMDLLFEVLPKFRIPYSASIEEVELGGKRCFDVNGGQLIACFDAQVGTATIEEMAKRCPDYAVMRDASMADDATQANFEELFRTYSPDTVRRVI